MPWSGSPPSETSRAEPAVSPATTAFESEIADDLAALPERMNVAVHALDIAELGAGQAHQLKMDRQEMLADDMQARGRQKMMDIGDATGDRVLDRDHRKTRLPLSHGCESILEGRRWQYLPIRMHLRASNMRIGARLALE